jgi:hypothetical protein
MERKILAWLGMAVSLLVCFPCACIAALGSVWAAALSVLSAAEIEDFLGPGTPPSQFWGAMTVPMAIIALVVLALALIFLIWGARTLLKARPEEKPLATE